MSRSTSWGRALRCGAAIGLVAFGSVGGVLVAPVRAGASSSVSVGAMGWWGSQPNAPGGLPVPTSTVPANAVAVGAQSGTGDKVAAVAVTLDVTPGATVDALLLRLTEASEQSTPAAPGASFGVAPKNDQGVNESPSGTSIAGVVACPITSPWTPARAGALAQAPTADCSLAKVSAQRSTGTGTWGFDLLPMAQLWTRTSSPLAPLGVLIQENVDAPRTFQVSYFDTTVSGAVTLSASITEPSTETTDETPTLVTDAGLGAPLAFDLSGFNAAPVALPPLPAPVVTTRNADASIPKAVRLRADLYGNLPFLLVVLVPLSLLVALLMSYTLGPAGQPVSVTRGGAVSRALGRRANPAGEGGEPS
jgi:hypothetical protein